MTLFVWKFRSCTHAELAVFLLTASSFEKVVRDFYTVGVIKASSFEKVVRDLYTVEVLASSKLGRVEAEKIFRFVEDLDFDQASKYVDEFRELAEKIMGECELPQ